MGLVIMSTKKQPSRVVGGGDILGRKGPEMLLSRADVLQDLKRPHPLASVSLSPRDAQWPSLASREAGSWWSVSSSCK